MQLESLLLRGKIAVKRARSETTAHINGYVSGADDLSNKRAKEAKAELKRVDRREMEKDNSKVEESGFGPVVKMRKTREFVAHSFAPAKTGWRKVLCCCCVYQIGQMHFLFPTSMSSKASHSELPFADVRERYYLFE